AESLSDGVGVAAGSDDVVAGGQRGLGDVDAQAAAGAGDEPGVLLSRHGFREAPCERLWESLSREVLAGSPSRLRSGLRWISWRQKRRPGSPCPPAAPRSRPSRQAWRPTVHGASRGCAAKRSRSWPASVSRTTPASNA